MGSMVPAHRGGLVEALRGWWQSREERWAGDPKLRRLAARFPFTRFLARRRARALFDLTTGFVHSQVLLAFVRLGMPDFLAGGGRDVADLAGRVGLDADGARRLLDAAVSLGLARRLGDGRYALGSLGVVLRAEAGLQAMIEHHALLYTDLADPVALLRGRGSPARIAGYWPYAASDAPAALDDGAVAPYSALMAASQPMVADQILDAHDFGQHRCLLDIGGGEGAFIAAVAARHSTLSFQLLDLPAVAARARQRLAALGLAGRVTAHGVDFRDSPLPLGADCASLVRVLHDHDDATAQGLLHRVAAALPPGGTLVVAEPMCGVAGAETVGAYFEFYLLAMGRGRPRDRFELEAMMRVAGFEDVALRRSSIPLLAQVITARRGPNVKFS